MTAKNPELEVFNPFDDSHVGSVKINSAMKLKKCWNVVSDFTKKTLED